MSKLSRVLVAVAALLLLGVYVFPLWSVHLTAPQYPEGLGMTIHVNTVRGLTEFDLDKINNLNHYIGMKAIEPDAIPELRYMPWIVAGLIAGGLLVAAAGRRGGLYLWLGAFVALGAAGLVDFWKWEYEYGHDLAPDAIISIPGMSYQPPLIGSKVLLNFTASSWPAPGALLAGLAFALGAVAVVHEWRRARLTHRRPLEGPAMRMARAGARVVVLFALLALVAACGHGPRPITYGQDACAYCRMVVSDPRYGAEAVTATGKVHTFDSIECLAAYVVQARASGAAIESAWVSDFARPGTLVPAAQARYVRVSGPGSPMGKGLTAFAPDADTAAIRRASGDTATLGWEDVLAVVGREGMERGLGAPVAPPTMDSAHAR